MWQLVDPGDTPLSEIWLLCDRESGCVASNSDGTFIATRERAELEPMQARMGGEVMSFADVNEVRVGLGMDPISFKAAGGEATAGRPTCNGCGEEIDPDWCMCGESMDASDHDSHLATPMGCECGNRPTPTQRLHGEP